MRLGSTKIPGASPCGDSRLRVDRKGGLPAGCTRRHSVRLAVKPVTPIPGFVDDRAPAPTGGSVPIGPISAIACLIPDPSAGFPARHAVRKEAGKFGVPRAPRGA